MSDESQAEHWDAEADSEFDSGLTWSRQLILALTGMIAGLLFYALTSPGMGITIDWPGLQGAIAVGIVVSSLSFTLCFEKATALASALLSLVIGGVAGALFYWQFDVGGDIYLFPGWAMLSLAISLGLAIAFFQAWRDRDPEDGLTYASVHDHLWINAVLWVSGWLFVMIVVGLLWLLAGLLGLVKIGFLRELLASRWFGPMLTGAAFGAAVGVLRDHDNVLRMLQRIAAQVLAILAPVMAAGLLIFLGGLPFAGLDALWDAWGSTTALLLGCTVGALVLANAVLGSDPEAESRSMVLRIGAMVAAAAATPLVVLAAMALWMRVGDEGLTPNRLWATVFVAVAALFALAYLVALAIGRLEWGRIARPANLALWGVVAIAFLLLSTPLVDFSAIAARDQVARLESGKVTPDEFDWDALSMRFGKPGRDAMETLKKSTNPKIAKRAADPWAHLAVRESPTREDIEAHLRVLPAGTKLADDLMERVSDQERCGYQGCTLFVTSGGAEAFLFLDDCFEDGRLKTPPAPVKKITADTPVALKIAAPRPAPPRPTVTINIPQPPVEACGALARWKKTAGGWQDLPPGASRAALDRNARFTGYQAGKIEVRPVTRRQVYVGGQPVGEAFE